MSESPVAQQEFWDRRAAAWERRSESIDALSDAYGLPVMEALRPAPGERIVDIGCGPGTTAIQMAGRVSPDGEVVGLDISPAMVAAAVRRAAALGTVNARFAVADAQRDVLEGGFDAAYSRFGVMFFDDPVAAFSNIGGALRAGGRLACAVWSSLSDNPWMFVPTLAAVPALEAEVALPGADDPGPFSFADPKRVLDVLTSAGFLDVDIEVVEGSRLISAGDAGDNVTTLLEVGPLGEAWDAADDDARRRAVDAVIASIEPYREEHGWRLPGSALKVLARRP